MELPPIAAAWSRSARGARSRRHGARGECDPEPRRLHERVRHRARLRGARAERRYLDAQVDSRLRPRTPTCFPVTHRGRRGLSDFRLAGDSRRGSHARLAGWLRERLRRVGINSISPDRRRHQLRDDGARPADACLRSGAPRAVGIRVRRRARRAHLTLLDDKEYALDPGIHW